MDAGAGHRGGDDAPTTGGVPADGIRVTRRVQRQVAKLLRECFALDLNPQTPAGAAGPTSAECERRLIALWDDVFAAHLGETLCGPAGANGVAV